MNAPLLIVLVDFEVPYILARAVTCDGPRHTNGHTTKYLYLPSAAIGGRSCSRDICSYPISFYAAMLGTHLPWDDRIQDEFLSWTDSWLFAVVHLYLRHLKGQREGYLCCVKRKEVYQVAESEEDATQLAEFFSALALGNAVDLHSHQCFQSPLKKGALVYRKFTHEYITHGPVETWETSELQHVAWASLVEHGLFQLLPELKIPEGMKARGLYEVLLYMRKVNYSSESQPTTTKELDKAEELAFLHSRITSPTRQNAVIIEPVQRPNLAIFMHYLSLRKRSADDALFQAKTKAMGYQRKMLWHILNIH